MPPPGVPPSYALKLPQPIVEQAEPYALREQLVTVFKSLNREIVAVSEARALVLECLQWTTFMQDVLEHVEPDADGIDHHPLAQEIVPRLTDLARRLGAEVAQ